MTSSELEAQMARRLRRERWRGGEGWGAWLRFEEDMPSGRCLVVCIASRLCRYCQMRRLGIVCPSIAIDSACNEWDDQMAGSQKCWTVYKEES